MPRVDDQVELLAGDARVLIDTANGGVVSSLRVGEEEFLVAGPERVRGIPHYGSFVLAPWVGEMYRGELNYGGEQHQLPLNREKHAVHGLVYDAPWTIGTSTRDSLEISCDLGPAWPFGGSIRQVFELDSAGLTQRVEVSADTAEMPVGIGWHPWFRIPPGGESVLRVDSPSYAELDDDLIPTGNVLPLGTVADFGEGFRIGSKHIDMVLLDARGPARLMLPTRTLDISFDPAISVLVVYAADTFICVEPWTSWPDAVRGRERDMSTGVIDLGPSESVQRWMRWSWSAPG